MINTHFGITHTPFSLEEQPLLQAQKEILEELRVHSYQRGLCIVAGSPGTGKTVLRKAFAASNQRQVTAHITRLLAKHVALAFWQSSSLLPFSWQSFS